MPGDLVEGGRIRSLKPKLASIGLALASLVGTLVALEVLIRLGRALEAPPQGGLTLYVEHDPLLGWRKRAGARALFRTREYRTEVSINSQGLRDPERGDPSQRSPFRILALGDSFVEGYCVALKDTVTQVLEASLARRGCPVEVVNGGTAGYSTDQEYLFYKTEGLRYSPQVVVLFFYYNDVPFNVEPYYTRPRMPKPLFRLEGGQLVLSNVPIPEPHSSPPGSALTHERRARGSTLETVSSRSALWEWLVERLASGAPKTFNRLARLGLWKPIALEAIPAEFMVFRANRTPQIDEAWQMTRLLLEALARDVNAKGSHFALAYVPSALEVDDRIWELSRLRYGMREDRWRREAVVQRLRAIAQTAGLPLVDLTPALRRANHGFWGRPYYAYDVHWNALGHSVAAHEVESFLKAEGWLPPCSDRARGKQSPQP